ncbi:MAG TPA: YdeI/OmpD-associated family protein [Candidatus Sulfotelmatobacter sp.]|jgi:uncharacterized protein YdeI (YjbR/CyaY-like superfamily)|nr:YdeI/OmpD-associated family protein [Candidatus Sulfotelmatobacter sp.]
MNEIPAEFAAELKAAGLEEFFADCTRSHRREYLKWIGEAKKTETRSARSRQAVTRLAAKRAEEQGRGRR